MLAVLSYPYHDCCFTHGIGVTVTGYGNMLARPLFREKHKPDMSEDDAMQLMKEALKVRHYLTICLCFHVKMSNQSRSGSPLQTVKCTD